jgi:hypothetical protein
MTSSARPRIDCGTVRPSALALEIDYQLELRRLLDWQIGGLGAFEDFSGVNPSLPIDGLVARPVTD